MFYLLFTNALLVDNDCDDVMIEMRANAPNLNIHQK